MRKIYCRNWFLETLLYLEFISTTPTLGDFLRAAVINKNPRPCELEVLVSLFGQVVVTGNVYRPSRVGLSSPGIMSKRGGFRAPDGDSAGS